MKERFESTRVPPDWAADVFVADKLGFGTFFSVEELDLLLLSLCVGGPSGGAGLSLVTVGLVSSASGSCSSSDDVGPSSISFQ